MLHIKDANNCTRDSNITLSQPAALSFIITKNNVLCNGGNTGAIGVSAGGGTPGYTYALNSGTYGPSSSFTALTSGIDTVHLKDANGCIKDTIIVISQPSLLRLSYSTTQPLCNGASNGSISIVGVGGTTPYSFALNSGIFGSSGAFSGIPAGVDTLHVNDANGCTKDSIITIGQPIAVAVTATKTNVLCNGGSTGTVTVSASGGVPPYTYAADAGTYNTSNLLTGLNAGAHTIHTKDVNGCLKDTVIIITEPAKLAISYTLVQPLCNGGSDGSITIAASGGTTPYLFSLSSSSFSSTTLYNGLGAGTYVLHIKRRKPVHARQQYYPRTAVACNGFACCDQCALQWQYDRRHWYNGRRRYAGLHLRAQQRRIRQYHCI